MIALPMSLTRRIFLQKLGIGTLGLGIGAVAPTVVCANNTPRIGFPFDPIAPSTEDDLVLPKGYQYQVIRAWGDKITSKDRFGFNCDFTAFFPFVGSNSQEALLWVNHEYTALPGSNLYEVTFPPVVGGTPSVEDHKTDTGGSVLHLRFDGRANRWEFLESSQYNRRITASPAGRPQLIEADGPVVRDVFERHNVDGLGRQIHGTSMNCGGAQTPWGTVLSAEEHFQANVPEEVDFDGRGKVGGGNVLNFNRLGSKYGWVVEIDPFDPHSMPVKHTALGRFRHENVALWARDGKPVVCYMAEDRSQGHAWKFISRDIYRRGAQNRTKNKSLLSEGRLYVARFEPSGEGRWIALDPETEVNPVKGAQVPQVRGGANKLGQVYSTFGAILVDAFHAANLSGGTPIPYPEDVEFNPVDGSVYFAIGGGSGGSDPVLFKPQLGQIWKLTESTDAPDSGRFQWTPFSISGGVPGSGGYSNPDNLLFDFKGNLWVATDMHTKSMNDRKHPAGHFGNNGLFVIPTAGSHKASQFASGPCEAELTGPCFTPDETTLFISVQHPGEGYGIRDGQKVNAPQGSNWPAKQLGKAPRPAVVAVYRS